jgi:hypothetical protein
MGKEMGNNALASTLRTGRLRRLTALPLAGCLPAKMPITPFFIRPSLFTLVN